MRRIESIAQLVTILQAQEEELIESITLTQDREPRTASRVIGT